MNARHSRQRVRRRDAREEITERIASRAFFRLNGMTSPLRSGIVPQWTMPCLSAKSGAAGVSVSRKFDRGRGELWGGSQSDVWRAFDPALEVLGVLDCHAAAVVG